MESIAFRLTAAQLAEIHNSVAKRVEHLRISKVDTVVGLLARCLSEVEPESRPIGAVSYVINVRAFIRFILFPMAEELPDTLGTASRDGHISGQRSGQCNRLALHGTATPGRR